MLKAERARIKRRRQRVREAILGKNATLAPPKEGRPPMAFYYVRYSAKVQEDGHSEEHQMAALDRMFAGLNGEFEKAPIVYFDAAVSAFSKPLGDRPHGRALLADVQAGDAILAYQADRLFRSQTDLCQTMKFLHGLGVRVVVGDLPVDWGTPMGKLMFQFLGMLAEFDSAQKGERIRAGQSIALRNGVAFGAESQTFAFVVDAEGHKRRVIRPQYLELYDEMARRLQEEGATGEAVAKYAQGVAAEIEGERREFDRSYGFSVKHVKDTVAPRLRHWRKATGRTIEVKGETYWLAPPQPPKKKKR